MIIYGHTDWKTIEYYESSPGYPLWINKGTIEKKANAVEISLHVAWKSVDPSNDLNGFLDIDLKEKILISYI